MLYSDKKVKVVDQVNKKEFRVNLDNGKSGIIDYAEIIRQLTHMDEEASDRWEIDKIIGHRWGKEKDRKGKIDINIKCKDYDDISWEPMEIIKKEDDPITLAKYTKANDLLEKQHWKLVKRYLALKKTSRFRIAHIYAKKTYQGTRYKFGEKIPRSVLRRPMS